MGRRAYGGSKAAADAYHQSHKEGERLVAQLLSSFVHDGEEHSAGGSIGDELSDEGTYQAYGCHQHNRVSATDVEDTVSETFGDARLLDGKTKDGTAGKDDEYFPVYGLHGLLHIAAATYEHGCSGKEGALQQRHNAESREGHHCYHDGTGDERAVPIVWHVFGFEEMEVSAQGGCVEVEMLRTYQQQRVTSLQNHISRGLFYTLAKSCCGNHYHVVVLLKRTAVHSLSYQTAAEGNVSREQPIVVGILFVQREDKLIGAHKIVSLHHLQNIFYLSCIYQMVTTHDEFVFCDG